MSTITATFRSREDHEKLFAEWPFWFFVRPDAYPYGAFIGECEITCVECALKALDAGEVEAVDMFSFDCPNASGEYCDRCDTYIVEPYCKECTREEGFLDGDWLYNTVMVHQNGEDAMCRMCYLTKLLDGTLDEYDRGAYAFTPPHFAKAPCLDSLIA